MAALLHDVDPPFPVSLSTDVILVGSSFTGEVAVPLTGTAVNDPDLAKSQAETAALMAEVPEQHSGTFRNIPVRSDSCTSDIRLSLFAPSYGRGT